MVCLGARLVTRLYVGCTFSYLHWASPIAGCSACISMNSCRLPPAPPRTSPARCRAPGSSFRSVPIRSDPFRSVPVNSAFFLIDVTAFRRNSEVPFRSVPVKSAPFLGTARAWSCQLPHCQLMSLGRLTDAQRSQGAGSRELCARGACHVTLMSSGRASLCVAVAAARRAAAHEFTSARRVRLSKSLGKSSPRNLAALCACDCERGPPPTSLATCVARVVAARVFARSACSRRSWH